MADEDEEGDFQQFADLLKTHPGGRRGQNFNHRYSFRGRGLFNRQRGRNEGFLNWKRGRGKGFRSSYGGYREDFDGNASNEIFRPPSVDEENASGHFNDMDLQYHYNNECFLQSCNQLHPNDRVHGGGRGRQNWQVSSDRFHGHGRGKSHARGHGCVGKQSYGRGHHHHGVSGYKDAGNSHCYGDGLKLHPDFGDKQGRNKIFAYGRSKVGGRGRGSLFRGSFKRVDGGSCDSTIRKTVDGNKANANVLSSADLPANSRFECNGDAIGSKICSRRLSLATKIDGAASLAIQKLEEQEASPLSQSPLATKCYSSPLPVPLESEAQNKGIVFQKEEDSVDSVDDQWHQKRAFISCIDGNNGKRQRSSAVRDFPERPDKLRISVAKKVLKKVVKKVIYRSKDSEALARDSVLANSIGEVGSLSNRRQTIENFSNSNILDLPTEFVLADPEVIAEDGSKTLLSNGDGPAELAQAVLKAATENASRTTLSEGDTLARSVQVNGEVDIENCNKEASSEEDDGQAEKVYVCHEAATERFSRTISCEEDELVEPVQAGPEVSFEDLPKTHQVDKDQSAEHAQSDLGVSNKELNEKLGSSSQSSCDGHGPPQCTSHLAIKSLHMKLPPQGPVEAPGIHMDTSFQKNSHSILKDKKKKPLMSWKAETQSVEGPLKTKSRNSKLYGLTAELTDTLSGLHNRGDLSKKLKVQDSCMVTENTGALVVYQSSKDGGTMKNKGLGELTDALNGLHNQGNVSKVQDSSTVTEDTGALVPYQSSKDGDMAKNKDPGELTATLTGLHNQENVSKKLKLHDSSEVIENTGVLVVNQSSKKGVSTKNKGGSGESTDALTGFHNRGNVSKKPKLQDSSNVTENTGALVLFQSSKKGGTMKNKDPGRRLVHKGNTRMKLFQTSRSFDSLMLKDPAKLSCLEGTEAVSARSLVKRTLQEYESVRKALVKSQDAVRRADLDAASLLKERGKWRNCEEKIVGEVPGVEVGDQFSFRMEMLIIGLHRQVQSGIDYIPGIKRKNGAPLATSIVASGGYEDDKDDGNTLIYSGQGGNIQKGNKKQESNQALVRGNLAMSNSMKERTPVRVIRGTTDLASPSSKVYTYDGLYDVVDLKFECGVAGYRVYHFTLTRRPGQPQVGLSFLSSLKKKGLARPHLLLSDISRGQERLPVCVVNEVDEETAPLHFTYIPSIKYPVWYSPLLPQGCNCVGGCDEGTCSCAAKNGGEFQYNEKGYIIRDKTVVYECGPSCSCSSFCENRVSQKGLRYRLEIFKTKNRGWGVRSMDSIQPGGFICEYTGELLSDAEAEQKVENDEYLFDLGNKCNPSRDQSDLVERNGSTAIVPVAEDVAYTIDAKDLGNVARFINHSCSPNLYAQNVLYDSDDLRFPHVMLFAMENIPPMRELTYDYNYTLDKVQDAYGNVKTKACYCGAQDCQGRLY